MNQNLLANRYRIVQKLGSGGFGDTFLAEDTHLPSSRICVIKQLRPMNSRVRRHRLPYSPPLRTGLDRFRSSGSSPFRRMQVLMAAFV